MQSGRRILLLETAYGNADDHRGLRRIGIEKANAAIILIAIEQADRVPHLGRAGRAGGRVVALFRSEDLHPNPG